MQTTALTYDEFVQWALLPENSEREFEFVNGRGVDILPTSTYLSGIAMRIAEYVYLYCRENAVSVYTSGAYGPYHVLDCVLAPSFGYKRTPMSGDYPDRTATIGVTLDVGDVIPGFTLPVTSLFEN